MRRDIFRHGDALLGGFRPSIGAFVLEPIGEALIVMLKT